MSRKCLSVSYLSACHRGSRDLAWHADGEKRKDKKVLLIYSKCIRFPKFITQKIPNLTLYLKSLSELKTQNMMSWRHQNYKTCKNIYFITSFQLDSVLRPGEVNCLFIFDNNSNSCVLLFNVRFYFFVAWQWKPAGCVDINYISYPFLPPSVPPKILY